MAGLLLSQNCFGRVHHGYQTCCRHHGIFQYQSSGTRKIRETGMRVGTVYPSFRRENQESVGNERRQEAECRADQADTGRNVVCHNHQGEDNFHYAQTVRITVGVVGEVSGAVFRNQLAFVVHILRIVGRVIV